MGNYFRRERTVPVVLVLSHGNMTRRKVSCQCRPEKGIQCTLLMNPPNATRLVTHLHVGDTSGFSSTQTLSEGQKDCKTFHGGCVYTKKKPHIIRLNIDLNSVAGSSDTRKRKHNDSDTEDDTPHATESEGVDKPVDNDESDADQEEEEYQSPKAKTTTAGRKAKAKSSPKKKAGPPAKKPRTEKAAMSKTLKASTRKGRKLKEGEDTYDPEQVAKDTKISADNPLFSE